MTGMVTASGGAWNASIIAEYFHLKDRRWRRWGWESRSVRRVIMGSSRFCCWRTIMMSLMVVTMNRLVWRPMFRLAESKFRLDV